jgi:hypothetical protein
VNDAEFDEHVAAAIERLRDRNEIAWSAYELDSCERYDYDLPSSRFWWSSRGVVRVEATLVTVGSVSTRAKTWMWAWANPSIPEGASADLLRVRDFGREHGFEKLTNPVWTGGEVDGWEMTALAARVLDSAVAYRSPSDDGPLFLLLDHLRRLDE